MQKSVPHYLLLTETDFDPTDSDHGGRWRFVLEPMNCDADRIEVSEHESDVWGERLELLSVVRGVEALDQPSKLTLITSSAYIGKRIRKGFESWIENEWRWERFGSLTSVKDVDLWKRIHAAMQIHSIECRLWQFGQSAARRRNLQRETAESNSWNRFDESHPTTRRSYAPVEFGENESFQTEPSFVNAMAVPADDEPRFVATKTGWTRVTEIDPDSSHSLQFPQAFGETVY